MEQKKVNQYQAISNGKVEALVIIKNFGETPSGVVAYYTSNLTSFSPFDSESELLTAVRRRGWRIVKK